MNTATGSDQNRPPFCAWKLPASGRWQSIDTLGQLSEIERVDDEDNRNWSGSVRIPQDSRAIELTVQGRPQHVLAFTDFTPLASIDEEEGEHEWQDCIITICVEDDRHAEGSFGESALPDAHRVLLIDAGQRYKHDFIAEQTVVGIADDGTLQRANAGYLTDDTDELEDIAKLAHGWYGTPRYALQFETHYMTSGLARGALIADLGIEWGDPNHYHPDINTVVTEIRITNNRTEEGEPDLPRMRVTTGAGELDPMQLLGRLAQPELKSWGELTGFHEGRAPEGNQ